MRTIIHGEGRSAADSICSVKPTNYNVSLYNLHFGGDWSYEGTVKIASTVKSSTEEIVVNVKEIEVTGADVYGKNESCECARLTGRDVID